MEERIFELGKTYKFIDNVTDEGYIILKFSRVNETYYYGLIVDTNIERFMHLVDTNYDKSLWRRGKILQKWDVIEVDVPFDPTIEFKNVKLKYDDPDVIDMYIDMALATGDKRWFNFLAKKKQEVVS